MTFAQLLHGVLDHFLGDEAFERRDRKKIERIRERLRDEVREEVFDEAFTTAWAEISESLRRTMPDGGKERIRQRLLSRHRGTRRQDATA